MMWNFPVILVLGKLLFICKITQIVLENVGYMLGFQSTSQVISKTTTAEREADLEYGFHDLYIYCDIAQVQYIGDALVPLLRIIPVEGSDVQRINKSFISPQYIPVDRKWGGQGGRSLGE